MRVTISIAQKKIDQLAENVVKHTPKMHYCALPTEEAKQDQGTADPAQQQAIQPQCIAMHHDLYSKLSPFKLRQLQLDAADEKKRREAAQCGEVQQLWCQLAELKRGEEAALEDIGFHGLPNVLRNFKFTEDQIEHMAAIYDDPWGHRIFDGKG